jgi:hypothetical protein
MLKQHKVVSRQFGKLRAGSSQQAATANLGTLTSVDVSITGQVSAEVLTQGNFVGTGDGGLIPLHAPFSVSVDLNFFGVSNGSFFTWLQPATFVFSGTGSGTGETQGLTDFFTFGFQFNSSTDIVGQTGVITTHRRPRRRLSPGR